MFKGVFMYFVKFSFHVIHEPGCPIGMVLNGPLIVPGPQVHQSRDPRSTSHVTQGSPVT